MKRGQLVEGYVESCDYPCKARVKCEEGIVAVKNALPGQKVLVRIGRSRDGRADGSLVEVLCRSTLETGRICAHFGDCGGCAYLSMSEGDEVSLKGEQMKKLFAEGLLSPDALKRILDQPKPNQKETIKVPAEIVRRYKPYYSAEQLREFIEKACEYYAQHLRNRDRGAR